MSIGVKIINEIAKQGMVRISYPDPEVEHVFVWMANAADQIDAIVAKYHNDSTLEEKRRLKDALNHIGEAKVLVREALAGKEQP